MIKKIKGDLFDIRENWDSPFNLEEYFSFSPAQMKNTADGLRHSVEEGVVEYKRSVILSVCSFLESLKYDSRGFDKIPMHSEALSKALFTLLLQRQIALGILKPRKSKQKEKEEEDAAPIEEEDGTKQVLKDLQNILKDKPELKTHPAVKNIFMQVQIYKKELDNMKTLLPNILPEKRQSFYGNFKNTFQKITEKIQDQYQALLSETREPEPVEFNPEDLFCYNIKDFAQFYGKQTESISEIRSALLFAQSEKYKTREALLSLALKREDFLSHFARELGMYSLHEKPNREGKLLSRLFALEIAAYLEKEAQSPFIQHMGK